MSIPNIVVACDALIVNDKGEVLLQKRGNTKVFGKTWNTPGGKLEQGERLEDALKREMKEEHGIDVEVLGFLQHYQFITNTSHALYFAYLTKIVHGTPQILEPDKCEALEWFPVNKLPSPLTEQAKEYIESYLKKFRND